MNIKYNSKFFFYIYFRLSRQNEIKFLLNFHLKKKNYAFHKRNKNKQDKFKNKKKKKRTEGLIRRIVTGR